MQTLIVGGEDADEPCDLVGSEVATVCDLFDELDLLGRVDQATHILIESLEGTCLSLLLVRISVATPWVVLGACRILLRSDDGWWGRGYGVGYGRWALYGGLLAIELRDSPVLEGYIDRKGSFGELVLEEIFPDLSVVLLDILVARLTEDTHDLALGHPTVDLADRLACFAQSARGECDDADRGREPCRYLHIGSRGVYDGEVSELRA